MKKIIPFIYLIVGLSFIGKGIYAFFKSQEIYYLIFSLETQSKTTFIAFNFIFGGLVLAAAYRRFKMLKA